MRGCEMLTYDFGVVTLEASRDMLGLVTRRLRTETFDKEQVQGLNIREKGDNK